MVQEWAMIVILAMADGSGMGIILDQETHQHPVFPSKEICQKELTHIGSQILPNIDKFDMTRSTLECVPAPNDEE